LITLKFPSTMAPDVGVAQVDALVGRLSQALPAYNVGVARQVADLSYTGNVTGGTGIGSDAPVEDYIAEIQIQEKNL